MPKQNHAQILKKKEKTYKKYNINFDAAVSNSLIALESASKYLVNNIKVNRLKGKVGESVKVSISQKEKLKNSILVEADNKIRFSKRYLKYLVKKFLKKENISLYLRVISSGSSGYSVKLFNRSTE